MRGRSSSLMPTPESRTRTQASGPSGHTSTVTWPPSRLYSTAFEHRDWSPARSGVAIAVHRRGVETRLDRDALAARRAAAPERPRPGRSARAPRRRDRAGWRRDRRARASAAARRGVPCAPLARRQVSNDSRYSSADRGRDSAHSVSAEIVASGVRSSCEASVVKRCWLSSARCSRSNAPLSACATCSSSFSVRSTAMRASRSPPAMAAAARLMRPIGASARPTRNQPPASDTSSAAIPPRRPCRRSADRIARLGRGRGRRAPARRRRRPASARGGRRASRTPAPPWCRNVERHRRPIDQLAAAFQTA